MKRKNELFDPLQKTIRTAARIFYTGLLIASFSPAFDAVGAMISMPTGLEKLALQALQNNEELQSLEENVQALRAEAPFAGSLENPRLSLGLANIPVDTFNLDQEAMTQKQIFISQKIPWFGKLDLAEQAAELAAVEQYSLFRGKQLETIRKLSQFWYDLDFIERSLETNHHLEEMVTQILRVAETRYATGKGLLQDILAAQVQISTLLDERISLESRKRLLNSNIGEMLNSEQLFQRNDPVDAPPDIIEILDSKKLTMEALEKNPFIHARKIALQKAGVKVKLAEKEYSPDMDFRVGYGQREDDPVSGNSRADFFSASVTLSLPLWQSKRQDSKFNAMEKRYSAAQKALSSYQKTLPHRVDALVTEITASLENHKLFLTTLTLQAEQLAQSSLAAYSVGKVDFDTMLGARIKTLKYQLQSQKYRYQALKKMAELEELTGEPSELLTELYSTKTTISSKERNE
jgi:cobalt-zinc-cadmium efflux system outer membrane protein